MTLYSIRGFRPVIAAAALAFAAGALVPQPARALDDDGSASIFDTLTGLLGSTLSLRSDDSQPRIKYRERAPLVVPPSNELRPPMPAVAKRNRAWPKDFDVRRAERARNAAWRERTVERDDAGNPVVSARELREKGRLARAPRRDPAREQCEEQQRDPLGQICNPGNFWSTLRNARSKSAAPLRPGVEPPRAKLTDPPRGLRVPSRVVKATREPPPQQIDIGDAQAFARQDARRANEE